MRQIRQVLQAMFHVKHRFGIGKYGVSPDLSRCYYSRSSKFIGGMAVPLQARSRYYFRLAVLSSHEAIRG